MRKQKRPLFGGLPLLGVLLLALAACGEPDPGKLNRQINDGDYGDVIGRLEAAIENSPTSPVYHLLAVRAHLLRCAHEEGMCAKLQPLAAHLAYATQPATQPIRLADGATLSLEGVMNDAFPAMARLPQHPKPFVDLLKTMPANRRSLLTDGMFVAASNLLLAGEVSPSTQLLRAIAGMPPDLLPANQRTWAGAMGSLVADDAQKESFFIALKSQKDPLSPAAASAAPAALYASLPQGPSTTQVFVQGLSSTLAGWKTPLLNNPLANAGIAEGLNRMRGSETFLSRALAGWGANGAVVATLSPSVPLSDPGVGLQLALTRLSLLFNPNQPALLANFMDLATRTMEKTGEADLIGDLSLERLDPETQAALVEKMFGILEAQQAAEQPLAPILLPLASLKLDKNNTTRLEKLLQTALEQAIAAKQASTAMAIAAARPTLAQNNRQLIAPLLVDDIRARLKANDFDQVAGLANFLSAKLGVSFNLDALILQGLAEDLKNSEAAQQLAASDTAWLLKPQADAAFDLGPYWAFVQEHFAGKGQIINNQLRALVASVGGTYGTATAMWRLDGEFDEAEFETGERTLYTNQAIQSALLADAGLSPGQLLELAGRLLVHHPDMPLAQVVEAALNRSATLDDSRAIWDAASPAARQVIMNVRPQFASLMRGVDAYNNKRVGAAAVEFSRITDSAYREQLLPYFDALQDRLNAIGGVYVNTDALSALPTAYIAVEAAALRPGGAKAGLTDVVMTLISRIGTQTLPDPATLGTTRGNVYTFPVQTTLDLGSGKLPLAGRLAEPSNLPQSSNQLFGPIEAIRFVPAAEGEPARLEAFVSGKSAPVVFERVQIDSDNIPLPRGRYLLTRPITEASTLLPPGTLLEMETETTTSGASDSAYAVQLRLAHPGFNAPQELEGRYESNGHTLTATYKAPLKQGGSAPAALKCQFIHTTLLCGAHYLNQPRQAYAHLVAGELTREGVSKLAVALQAADDAYLNSLRGSNPLLERLVETQTRRDPKVSGKSLNDYLVSGTGVVSATDAPSGSAVAAPAAAVATSGTGVISSSAMGFGGALIGIDAPAPGEHAPGKK